MIIDHISTSKSNKKLITPVISTNTKLPSKFEEVYRKSVHIKNELVNNISQSSKNINTDDNGKTENNGTKRRGKNQKNK